MRRLHSGADSAGVTVPAGTVAAGAPASDRPTAGTAAAASTAGASAATANIGEARVGSGEIVSVFVVADYAVWTAAGTGGRAVGAVARLDVAFGTAVVVSGSLVADTAIAAGRGLLIELTVDVRFRLGLTVSVTASDIGIADVGGITSIGVADGRAVVRTGSATAAFRVGTNGREVPEGAVGGYRPTR